MSRGERALRPLLPLLLGAPLLVACPHRAPPEAQTKETVQSIHFKGNSGADFALRSVMEQPQNPPLVWLVKPQKRRTFLDRETLELDAWRIETWYAHKGYFDAKVMGWDVRLKSEGKPFLFWDPPPKVTIKGFIEPGEASLVKELKFVGMDRLGGPILSGLRTESPLQEGSPFVADDLTALEDMILATLQERSYAFATVEAKAEVRPSDKQVTVTVTADLGPSCKFGKVTISHLGSPDLVRVPDELIRNELDVKDGQPYRASSLAKTQRRLFGLGVFSVVNVIPDLENAEGAVVPVRIELARSKYRQIKVGTGILLESGKQDVHVSGDFQHVNLFNKLVRLDFENTLGYTTLVQLDQVTEDGIEEVLSTSGPTVLSTLSFSVPGVPTRGWRVGNDLSFEMGVEQGYRYASQEISPNITAQLSKKISVSASYHFQLFQYIDLQLSEDEFRKTPLGLDFREKYVLTWLGQTFTYDSRNDPMVPTRGRYGIYEIAEAGTWTGGDFNFLRLRMDQRAYWSLVSFLPRGMRGALAIRAGGGLAHPYGEETAASVPYRERLYLGGSGDVRGWVRNHLGPYICDPEAGVDCIGTPGNTQGGDTILPIGGLVSLFGSLETRFYFTGDYGFVLFLDAGNAWADLDGVWDPSQSGLPIHLLPSTGLGARYISPIGAIRFDLARRLDQEPMYALEPRWGVHFSLSEAF